MFGIFDSDKEEKIYKKEVNEKLSDPKNPPPLEDLLQLEGIVTELQNKNKNLINYFTKEKIKQMIDYIIKEPKDDDYNKGHKFPFVCSKLFNIEEKNIMNYFYMTNKELSEDKNNQKNLSQNNIIENNTDNKNNNDNNDNDDINKYYKTGFCDNFEDDHFDEINMDDIPNFDLNEPENNDKEKKDEDEDNIINYKDNDDNNEKYDNEEDMINLDYKKDNIDEDAVNTGFIEEEKNEKDKDDEIVNFNDENDNKNNNDGYHDIITEKVLKEINEEKEYNDDDNDHEINNINKEDKKEINIINNDIMENTQEKKEENKIEEIKEEYPEDQIELLDYFLSFVSTESELNYVLCGYFSSLMLILLNNHFIKIIKYIFLKKKDILKKLVYHSYRNSIAETLCKIIKYEDKVNNNSEIIDNNDNEKYDEKEFNEIRFEILKEIFNNIDINIDTEKFSSLKYLITNLIENKKIFDTILNTKEFLDLLINKQISNINLQKNINNEDDATYFNKKNNFIILCDIIIDILNNVKNNEIQIPMLLYEVNEDFDDDSVQQNDALPELHHTLLSQILCDILPNLIENNFNINENNNNYNNLFIQSYNDEKIAPLGLYKIKILELISHIIIYFRNIPSELDNILIKSNLCTNIINYIFQYQNNNLYQETVFQFFNNLFKKEEGCPIHEKLFDHIFSELNLLEKIKTNFPKVENEGNTGVGYTPFLVNLSYKINSIIGGNLLVSDKKYIKQGTITFMTRGKNLRLNGFIDMDINLNNENNSTSNDNDKSISALNKYCNDEWKYFFSEKIESKVKLYEDILYDEKNTYDLNDLFYSPNKENENEKIEIKGNKRYQNINELFFETNAYNNDNNNYNKNSINKDMEININDFNFIINDINKRENKENDEDDKEFNDINYWKNDIEENKNSYLSSMAEEAMNDLLE